MQRPASAFSAASSFGYFSDDSRGGWCGAPSRPMSAAVSRRTAATPPPPCAGARRGLCVEVADLPSILTDAARRPELKKKLNGWLRSRLPLPEIRKLLQEDQEDRAAAADGMPAAAAARYETVRQVLIDAAVTFPAFKGVLAVVTSEVDRLLEELRTAREGSANATLRSTMDRLQKEILRLTGERAGLLSECEGLREINEELRAANDAHHERHCQLTEHCNAMHEQLQSCAQRLFINDAEAAQRSDETAAVVNAAALDGCFTGLRLDGGDTTAAEFQAAAMRITVEVEHLRAANHALGAARVDQLAQANATQQELNSALKKINELTAQVQQLTQAVAEAEAKTAETEREKQAYIAGEARWREIATELQIERTRRLLLEDELLQLHQLVDQTAARRGLVPHAEVERRPHYPGRGLADNVPKFLRTKQQKVRNSKALTRKQCTDLLSELWATRTQQATRGSFCDFVADFIAGKEAGEQARCELGYALYDACRQLRRYSADAEVTLRVVEGTAPEELRERMEQCAAELRTAVERLCGKKTGKSAGKLQAAVLLGTAQQLSAVKRGASLQLISDTVVLNEKRAGEYLMAKLRLALTHDRPQLAPADYNSLEVDAIGLLDGPVAPQITELCRRAVLQQHDAHWFALYSSLLKSVADKEDRTAPAGQVQGVMLNADAKMQNAELLRRFRVCGGVAALGPTGELDPAVRVGVDSFAAALRGNCIVVPREAGWLAR